MFFSNLPSLTCGLLFGVAAASPLLSDVLSDGLSDGNITHSLELRGTYPNHVFTIHLLNSWQQHPPHQSPQLGWRACTFIRNMQQQHIAIPKSTRLARKLHAAATHALWFKHYP